MALEIKVVHGSILEADVQAIVNAANSLGEMGGGVAGVIRRAAGAEVEREAMAQAPTPVGEAILTSAGKTRFLGIIHAPTMERPAMRIPAGNVARATEAALRLAEERGLESTALPGLGTGVGRVSHRDAAAAMVGAIRAFEGKRVKRVVLVDVDRQMVEAWREEIGPEGQGRGPGETDRGKGGSGR